MAGWNDPSKVVNRKMKTKIQIRISKNDLGILVGVLLVLAIILAVVSGLQRMFQ